MNTSQKILVFGANSYIGNSLRTWLAKRGNYVVDELDAIGEKWQSESFSSYDAIVHVAGIVHIKEKAGMWPLYQAVNCDLAFRVAEKAKREGVKHFVFMSTKGVYTPNTKLIHADTPAHPTKMYGKSKLAGEEKIKPLADSTFKISIIRAPTVYGEGCRGNFPRLVALSKRIHVFPLLPNNRSMIYIWNLCEFIRRIVDAPLDDVVLFPQDKEYGGTLKFMRGLWESRHEKYHLSRLMAWVVKIWLKLKKEGPLHTMFLDSVYVFSLSDYFGFEYCIYSFDQAMERQVRSPVK